GTPIPGPLEAPCTVVGVRGPITYDAFKATGHDVSGVRFLKDPGLLIRFLAGPEPAVPQAGRVIFIPHYRERHLYKSLPKGITLVDIDAEPLELARTIREANLVYASSLHGIIFAHALERPCVWVKPQTEE